MSIRDSEDKETTAMSHPIHSYIFWYCYLDRNELKMQIFHGMVI